MEKVLEIFESCKQKADETFNADLWSEQNILQYAKRAELEQENIQFLTDFIQFADENVKRFMWQYYYMMFLSDANFWDDIWQLERIPLPEQAEAKFPGAIRACVYLVAADHLRNWAKNTEFDPEELVTSYYKRYKNAVYRNKYSHNTYGLCRLSSFSYAYAYPHILPVGLFTFQRRPHDKFCEVYENKKGERLFVAVPFYKYNEKGFHAEEGYTPVYEINGDILTANTFETEKGALNLTPENIDLKEYTKILSPGEPILTIHIPGEKPLDKEEVIKSIQDAKRLCAKYFPPYKAVVCTTWFIDPNLRGEVIKEGSNMAFFADLFDKVCGRDNKNASIFEHVFETTEQPLENLVPKNNFQQRLVDRALRGEKIHWTFGILKNNI